jgi:hypothetical protein
LNRINWNTDHSVIVGGHHISCMANLTDGLTRDLELKQTQLES